MFESDVSEVVHQLTKTELDKLVEDFPSLETHSEVQTALMRMSMESVRHELYEAMFGEKPGMKSEEECLDAIKYGIDNGKHVSARSPSGETMLSIACRHGHLAVYFAARLIDDDRTIVNDDVNRFNGRTPLFWVATHGQSALLHKLLKRGCFPFSDILEEAIIRFGAGTEVYQLMAYGAKPTRSLCQRLLIQSRLDCLDIILQWDRTYLDDMTQIVMREDLVGAAALLIMHGADFSKSGGMFSILFRRFNNSSATSSM